MDRIRKQVWEGDLAELRASGKGYMPTAFPGFSWDKLRRLPPGRTMIPRRAPLSRTIPDEMPFPKD